MRQSNLTDADRFWKSVQLEQIRMCTVPLMLVRTLPVTGTCIYKPDRPPCYQLPSPVRTFKTITHEGSKKQIFYSKLLDI